MTRLALGTVQFGIDYGISNQSGKVSMDAVEKIITFCIQNGIDTLDTAQCYGESEKVLGHFDLSRFKVVTKLIENRSLEKSLENLKLSNVYALMFHREDDINDQSFAIFEEYKKKRLTDKIGVSVYSPQKLYEIITCFDIDIVQLPLNLLDQRFIPLFPLLKEKGIEIHTRSAFLQGLLLMTKENVPPFFDNIKEVLEKIPEPKLAQALHFVKNIPQVDKIVVGCTSITEIQEIVQIYEKEIPSCDYKFFRVNDERYINPSNWEKK